MDAQYDVKMAAEKEWDNWRVFRVFFFPALGGLLFGYDIGATSYVSGQLMDKDNSGTTWHNVVDGNVLLQGAITSSGVGGALIGSILVFKVTEAFGTRREMLLASVLFAVGAFIEALAATSSFSASLGIGVLLLGRWTYGVGCGFAMHGAPSYIGELSPPSIRGALVSLKEGMIVLGMLLGYGIGFAMLNTEGGWCYTYGVAMVPALFMFLGVSALPSPPRWLLGRGEHVAAREAASFVFPNSAAEGDRVLAEAAASVRDKEQANLRRGSGSSGPPPLFTEKNRRALVAGLGVVTLQQITGQPSVLYYAASIFEEAGISSYAAVLTGAFKLVATLGSVVVVDKYGRRWLLFVGISLMLFALTVMCVAFYGYETDDDDDCDDENDGFTPRTATIIAGMFLYIGGYQISFGPIAWLLIAEIFATDVRDSAIAVAVQCNFAWNLIVSFAYPSIVAGLATVVGADRKYTAAFGIFDVLTAYALWFVYHNVPETKGLSLEEIERLLASPTSASSSSSSSSSLSGGGGQGGTGGGSGGGRSKNSILSIGSGNPLNGCNGGGGERPGHGGQHSIARSLTGHHVSTSTTSTMAFNEPLLTDGESGTSNSAYDSVDGPSNQNRREPSAYDANMNSF